MMTAEQIRHSVTAIRRPGRIARSLDNTFYVYSEYYVQRSDDVHIPQHVKWSDARGDR
jgi:hypothetical protein